MKQKTNKKACTRPDLAAFVSRWKLSQVILSDQIGMNYSTFKQKLNPANKSHYFSDEEFDEIVMAIEQQAESFRAFVKMAKANKKLSKAGSKSKILFPKNQVAPFVLSHQFETLDKPQHVI